MFESNWQIYSYFVIFEQSLSHFNGISWVGINIGIYIVRCVYRKYSSYLFKSRWCTLSVLVWFECLYWSFLHCWTSIEFKWNNTYVPYFDGLKDSFLRHLENPSCSSLLVMWLCRYDLGTESCHQLLAFNISKQLKFLLDLVLYLFVNRFICIFS